jgi:hypothetical protein
VLAASLRAAPELWVSTSLHADWPRGLKCFQKADEGLDNHNAKLASVYHMFNMTTGKKVVALLQLIYTRSCRASHMQYLHCIPGICSFITLIQLVLGFQVGILSEAMAPGGSPSTVASLQMKTSM